MIVFLYGEDEWRRGFKKKEIIAQFRKKNPSASVGLFDFEEEESEKKLAGFLEQNSLFASKKLAVVESFGPNQKSKDTLKYFLEDVSSVILISSGKKPEKSFGFLLKPPAVFEEFEFLAGAEWKNFLKKEAERLGMNMNSEALDFLAGVYEKDTWRALTELQKLSGMEKVGVKELSSLDLEASPDYWQTVQKVKGRSLKERLTGLYVLSATNEPAGKLFNILSSFWYEKKSQFAVHDVNAKSGKLEYEEALLDITIS